MTIERQKEFLSDLTSRLAPDPRVRAAWLEGSWGRGTPDRYSDVDIHLLIHEEHVEQFRNESETWLGEIKPLVLFNLMFNGRMINALTEDGLRIDIWLHTENTVPLYTARVHLLYQTEGALELEDLPPAKDRQATAANLLRLTKELWRCISLMPSVLGRKESITGYIGLGIEINLLTDLIISGYEIDRDTGMKNLNRFLPDSTQSEIEQILAQLDFSPTGLAKAHLALAELIRRYGPIIAQRHGYEYPQKLERAVLRYVQDELDALNLTDTVN